MRKYFFLAIALLCCGMLQAQLIVNYSGGYSSYDTGSMRDLMRSIQNIIHVIDIGYLFEKHEFGVKGDGYHSTGGKLSLKDYSGEYANRFIVNGIRAGIYYKNYFFTYENREEKPLFSFFGEISPGIFMTRLKNRGFLIVHDEEVDRFEETHDTSSLSFLTQVGAKYYVFKNVNIHFSIGYDFVPKAEWEDFSSKSASVDWSGARFTGGVGFSF